MRPRLAIVIPCYNEEAVLSITYKMFLDELDLLKEKKLVAMDSQILFINDGSSDRTWEIIRDLAEKYECIEGISQSRNRGHQNAVLAGLMEVRDSFDITISIDCDGQDDIAVMEQMVKAYFEGAEVVYGVRNNRDTDSFFKRFTAQFFYRLLDFLGADIIYNHADYRLVSSRVLNELANYREVNLFLRGMFPLVGFESTQVYYSRNERLAGKSHYSLRKMFSLAFDGVTSLSVKPIRLIIVFGIIVALLSFCAVVWATVRYLTGDVVNGWASTMCVVCFIGGMQLVSIGVIGEYIGKIYLETKARPRYIISERTYHKK